MDLSLLLNIPLLVALLGILVATVTDIKSHEVPDWLSYSLIALGLLFSAAHTVITHELTIVYSLLGLGFGYAVGALLYYTGQWGGGDAKLLMGLGALITLPYTWFTQLATQFTFTLFTLKALPFFLLFLVFLIVCGSIYGMVWMLVLVLYNWKRFRKLFSQRVAHFKTQRIIVLTASGAFLLLAILMATGVFVGGIAAASLLFLLALLVYGSFYLLVAVKLAEQEFMLKQVPASKLTEGEWVVGGVKLNNEWVIPENNIGATKEQIALLKKRAPNKEITIKEGVPFVPSFLFAFIATIILATI
jgi:Flp pilus assembly protein protease CpaA